MKTSSRLLIVAALAIVLLGAYALITKHMQPQPEPAVIVPTATTTPQDTSLATFVSGSVSFMYPREFTLGSAGDVVNRPWSEVATTTGVVVGMVTIPKSYLPGTNFSDAVFTIGTSTSAASIATCLKDPQNQKTTMQTINGTTYTKFTDSDAGAGNRYETTSYRTLKDKTCYAVEYTIHSTNIGNYDPSQGVKEFPKEQVTGALEKIVASTRI